MSTKACHLIFYLLTGALLLSGLDTRAQAVFPPLPPDQRLHVSAALAAGAIKIDGKADESDWAGAALATHFMTSYPRQGLKAAYETEVRVLYDRQKLYISAKCYYPPGKKNLQVQDMRRDFGFSNNELFEVLIDPFKDPRLPVMTFCVTPYGTQMDIMHYADGSYDYKWDALWEAASTVSDNYWTTEIAIPFSSLRNPADQTEWSINFIRNTRMIGELSGWSPWPLAFNESRMEYAGILTDIKPPKPKLDLRIEPYALISSHATNTASSAYKQKQAGKLNMRSVPTPYSKLR